MKRTPLYLIPVFAFVCEMDHVYAQVPMCTQPPSFVEARNYDDFDFSRLPNQVLVARIAEVWTSNKSRGMKLLIRHNFKTMKSDVKCSRAPDQESMNLSVWIPTLIDLSNEKKWGDSIWQIQAITGEKKVGVWSQKTRLAPVDEVRKIAQKGVWRPVDSDSYELIWEQSSGGTKYSVRVVFDVLR